MKDPSLSSQPTIQIDVNPGQDYRKALLSLKTKVIIPDAVVILLT